MNNICYRCGSSENIMPKPYNGHKLYMCRPCNMAKWKKYYKTPIGKKSVQNSVEKYQKNNPLRTEAWHRIGHKKTSPCIECGEPRVHRHHPDPNDEYRIVYLCPLHHRQVHDGRLVIGSQFEVVLPRFKTRKNKTDILKVTTKKIRVA